MSKYPILIYYTLVKLNTNKFLESAMIFITIECLCLEMINFLVDPSHLTEGSQPNIHPGCISSTGRGRVIASPTSTHTAQLIGGAISPSLFSSPNGTQVST